MTFKEFNFNIICEILGIAHFLKFLSCWSEFAAASANSQSANKCTFRYAWRHSGCSATAGSHLFQVSLVKWKNQTQSIRLNGNWCKRPLHVPEASRCCWLPSLSPSLRLDRTDFGVSDSWWRLWPQQTRLIKGIQYCLLLPHRKRLLCKHSLMANLRRTLPGKERDCSV